MESKCKQCIPTKKYTLAKKRVLWDYQRFNKIHAKKKTYSEIILVQYFGVPYFTLFFWVIHVLKMLELDFKNDVTKSLDNSTYHVSKKNYSLKIIFNKSNNIT